MKISASHPLELVEGDAAVAAVTVIPEVPRPLGLREDFKVEPAAIDRLQAIEAFDLEPLDSDLLTRAHPPFQGRELAAVKFSLRRFLSLPLLFPGVMIVPPQRLDDAWHEFVLHTKRYQQFCDVTIGQFVHHIPASETEGSLAEKQAYLAKGLAITRIHYTEAYAAPPTWLWDEYEPWKNLPTAQRIFVKTAMRVHERLARQIAAASSVDLQPARS